MAAVGPARMLQIAACYPPDLLTVPLGTHPVPPPCRRLGHLDLNAEGAAGGGEQPPASAGQHGGDGEEEEERDDAARLTEIYDRMAQIGADSAESRASKILHGLGFTEAMQVGAPGCAQPRRTASMHPSRACKRGVATP